VSTAQEIENAIRSLSPVERDKLVQHIPQLFPEFAGDAEWERITRDDRPRPALTELLNRYEAELARDSHAFPKVAEGDAFDQRFPI
jgi:hypothetical protein